MAKPLATTNATLPKIMMPKRSHRSNLHNNELLILDFLATSGRAAAQHLSEDKYAVHMNVNYSHGLNLEQTKKLLEQLLYKKLVSRELDEIPVVGFDRNTQERTFSEIQDFIYSLTKYGGDIWSSERTPLWNKFCIDSFYEEKNEILELSSTNLKIIYEFAQHIHRYKLYNFNIDDLSLSESECTIIHWKNFKHVYSLRTICHPDEFMHMINWRDFHKTRTYWRDLSELQKFL